MHAETQLGADNRPSETPLGKLERALGAAREAVIREQDALIDDLAAQTLRFRTVIRLVKEGVAFFDEGGQLVVANKSYAEIYRLGPEATRPGAAAPEPIQRLFREDQFAAGRCPSRGQTACAWTQRPFGESEADAETSCAHGDLPCFRKHTVDFPDGRFVEILIAHVPGGCVSTHRDVTAVRQRETLAAERVSLQTLIDLVPDNLWLKDAQSRFVIANDATAHRMGYASPANLIDKTDLELCPLETAQRYFADERRIVETGEPLIDHEEYLIAPDGRKVWVSSTKVPLFTEDGVAGLVGVSRDITARKLAETLRDGQAHILEMIATNAPLPGILECLTRLIESQLVGVRSSVLLLDEDGVHLRHGAAPNLPEAYVKAIDGAEIGPTVGSCGAAAYTREPVVVPDVTIDPRWAPYLDLATANGIRSCWSAPILSHQEQVLGTFALYSEHVRQPSPAESRLIDVATKIAGIAIERKLAEERIQFMATHDALTKLPNRALLKDRLTQALLLAERHDRWATVVFIDLDNFKYVNDSLGHNAGDDLLRAMAQRMLDCVRATDTVVRLGGDEFVIVLGDQEKSIETITDTLRRLQSAIASPVELCGHGLRLTGSIGVAIYPNDARDAEALLANADAAMYRAKENGRDNFQFYRPEINLRLQEKFSMQEALRLALTGRQFVLHYQPQLDLHTGAILGVEALIRWRHPTHGLLPPARFIPLAEETGLITGIGAWVITEACRQAEAWREQGMPPIRMSVNVSARQFRERGLTGVVAAALSDSGLDPRQLELELTESMIMQDVDQALGTMEELEELGVQLSIDDFGTGYSSLAALKTFPVGRLKIDMSFIKGLPDDEDDRTVAAAVISLGQKLKLKVIAEGVETAEQVDFLRRNCCDEMQGYHLSKPIPPDELAAFLRRWVEGGGAAAA